MLASHKTSQPERPNASAPKTVSDSDSSSGSDEEVGGTCRLGTEDWKIRRYLSFFMETSKKNKNTNFCVLSIVATEYSETEGLTWHFRIS